MHVVRQLWIQLRLVPLLALPSAAALVALAVFDSSGSAAARGALAIGFAIAIVVAATLVGAAFSWELASGSAAWFAVRAVRRTSLLNAWLVMPMLIVGAAFLLAGVLAGLGLPPPTDRGADPVTVVVIVVAAAAPVVPLIASALLIGIHAPPRLAMLTTATLSVVLGAVTLSMGTSVIHPAIGLWLVASATPVDRPITVGLEAIGLCLALAAILWLIAAWRLNRRDL